jgi:CheY-like chemotaxis protein
MQELISIIPAVREIKTAMNGREALVQVTQASTPFTFIFLDIHMPIMDGN